MYQYSGIKNSCITDIHQPSRQTCGKLFLVVRKNNGLGNERINLNICINLFARLKSSNRLRHHRHSSDATSGIRKPVSVDNRRCIFAIDNFNLPLLNFLTIPKNR